ncbi:MAG: cytosine permease [Nitrososphaerota archaeon]|nr:cytosine permease [Nitrososphaerota archaeon]MDG7023101.1 cytosine permease [Nitrososphaerota archaeon]
MADRPAEVEKTGIEHVTDEQRHGTPGRVFTLWFAANLTIADYVVGVLCVLPSGQGFGLTVPQAVPILLVGNLLGGLFVGLAAAMGPTLGFPQIVSSRASFGRFGNYLPGALNWMSTVGWFTVNTILAVFALQVIFPGADFVAGAAAYVVIQAVIAIYGHDFIHLFEKVMSVVLGVLFLLIFAITLPNLGSALAYVPGGATGALSFGAVGTVLVSCFSYLMSWSPYASDYSRYLPRTASKSKVLLLALAGGAASSFAVEVVGALVGSITPVQSGASYFGGLNSAVGAFGWVAMVTLILGAFAADALNLYTNSLSALVLGVKTNRWKTVAAGAVVGFVLAVAVGEQFEPFYESFLLLLSYWIMPWLAIVIVDFFLARRTTVESSANPKGWDIGALAVYLVSVVVSVPFMVPLISIGFPVGALASWFGGADFSYFISFLVAAALTTLVRRAVR